MNRPATPPTKKATQPRSSAPRNANLVMVLIACIVRIVHLTADFAFTVILPCQEFAAGSATVVIERILVVIGLSDGVQEWSMAFFYRRFTRGGAGLIIICPPSRKPYLEQTGEHQSRNFFNFILMWES